MRITPTGDDGTLVQVSNERVHDDNDSIVLLHKEADQKPATTRSDQKRAEAGEAGANSCLFRRLLKYPVLGPPSKNGCRRNYAPRYGTYVKECHNTSRAKDTKIRR